VYHQAAQPGVRASWDERFADYASHNVLGTQRLLEAARHVGVRRFVHASSSSIYGNALSYPTDEAAVPAPFSPYGVTKLAAEHLILANVATRGLDASIVRYFSIFGPRQRPDMAYHLFAEALLDGRAITVFGDGEQSRSNTFIDDCVAGTIAAIDGAATGETYNIAGGEEITLNEAIATIADVLGVEPRIERGPARDGDQRRTAADTSKAQRAFGYRATTGAREGLEAQVAWHVSRRRTAVG
jgi:nucleoside-diphosphate-sugar epimerase